MKKINLLLVTGALLAMTSCEVPVTSEEISSIIECLQSTNPIEVVKSIDIVKDEISIDEVVANKLAVVDLTASIMCMENKMPMYVFGLNEENSIVKAMSGEFAGTKVTV